MNEKIVDFKVDLDTKYQDPRNPNKWRFGESPLTAFRKFNEFLDVIDRKVVHASPTEPTTTFSSMLWLSTASIDAPVLYVRSGDNTEWISVSGIGEEVKYRSGNKITSLSQYILAPDGNAYVIRSPSLLPYTINGNWQSESANFILGLDSLLRDQLSSPLGASMVKLSDGMSIEERFRGIRKTPFDFGVKGNGTHDDTENLRSYHIYCNENNISADYDGLKCIRIQANAKIMVNTDFDLRGCPIYIIDGIKENPNADNIAFIVEDALTPLVTITGQVSQEDLYEGSFYPTRGLFEGPGYARLTCEDLRIPNRAADGSAPYQQSFHVIKDSQVTQPLSMDLSGDISLTYRLNSERGALIVSNINIVDDGNWNSQTLFSIRRNKTKVSGFSITITESGGKGGISYMIRPQSVSDFHLEKVNCNGMVYSNTGTYILGFNGGADVFLDSIYVATGWGWSGMNYINGLYCSNMSVDRVDCHASLHNAFLNNITFTGIGLSVGWGAGIVQMSNIIARKSSAYYARNDYGSWFYGSIQINGIVLHDSIDSRPTVRFNKVGGVGTRTFASKTIQISNVSLVRRNYLGSSVGKTKLIEISAKQLSTGSVIFPQSITVNDISSQTFEDITFDINMDNFSRASGSVIDIDNVSGMNVEFNMLGRAINDSNRSNICLSNIKRNTSIVLDSKPQRVDLSKIYALNRFLVNSTENIACRVNIYDSTLISPIVSGEMVGVDYISANSNTSIYNTELRGNFDLSKVDSLMGVKITSSTYTLPQDVTPALAFTGWRRQSE